MITVTVYTKPACIQCEWTKKHLDRAGVAYDLLDVTESDDALATVKGLGYLQAPVVVLSNGQHWGGFRPDNLDALAARLKEAA